MKRFVHAALWFYMFVLICFTILSFSGVLKGADTPLPPPVAGPTFKATPLPPAVAAPPGSVVTASGRVIVQRGGVWVYADESPAAPVVAVQAPFPTATTTPHTTVLPAVGSSYPYTVVGLGGHTRIGAPTTARYGTTRPFSGSYGVTSNCGPLG